MEYKSPIIIGLEIDEFSNESGVDVISLVESPAIESDFMYFKSQIENKKKEYTDAEIFEMVVEDIINQKYVSDLPQDIQEKLLIALELVGEKESDLEREGWVLIDDESKFAISSKPSLPSIEDYGNFKIRYKYTGPKDNKNRTFCSRMLSAGLVFRKEDINKLTISAENSEFGIYDIFTYKGSYGCRHYWTRLVYQKVGDDVVETQQTSTDAATSVNPTPTMNRNPNSPSLVQSFAEQSGEKMIIAGPMMIPNKMIYRWDEMMGEYWVYFSKDTIQKIAYKFLIDKNQRNTNLEHSEEMKLDDIVLVESWLVENPEKDKSYDLMGKTYEKGTWFGVMKVLNKGVWEDYVKTGRVKGFSVEGYFADKIINKFQKHQFYYRTTKGGTEIVIDHETLVVFILKDGERSAILPDGTYELDNGNKLQVIDSKAVKGSF
jgi:hypothetical protein